MTFQSNHRPVRARYKPLAQLEAKAKDRQVLSWAWQKANESMTYKEHLLRFAYAHTPVHRVPAFVRDKAAGMVKHCCRALALNNVSIIWLEWALKPSRSVCFVLDQPIQGMALAGKRSGEGFGFSGTCVNRRLLLAELFELQAAGDVALIRWDMHLLEMLFTVAHEVKHLWYGNNDQGQSYSEEEAVCNSFAAEMMIARRIK